MEITELTDTRFLPETLHHVMALEDFQVTTRVTDVSHITFALPDFTSLRCSLPAASSSHRFALPLPPQFVVDHAKQQVLLKRLQRSNAS